jgi:hypothetical protein
MPLLTISIYQTANTRIETDAFGEIEVGYSSGSESIWLIVDRSQQTNTGVHRLSGTML